MMNFDTQTLVTIQQLLIPVLKTFTGFDLVAFEAGNADVFTIVGNGLGELSTLFMLVGAALKDGLLTVDEINGIVAQAKTLPLAIDAIMARLGAKTPTA